MQRRTAGIALAALALAGNVRAADYTAGPADYQAVVPTLAPGDTLHLTSGTYADLLNVADLHGTAEQPIVIAGPETGDPAVFVADPGPCCNTIEIRRSSYVVLRHLTVDGRGVDGAFGVSAKDGTSNLVHHITIEDCTFLHHDGSQQHVAISTKTPTWGWVIRRNRIVGAGTGMYLGNSDGTAPFVAGLLEHNLVADTIGYNIQIKWQQPRPAVEGMPAGPSVTILRHNVFVKTDRPSPDGDRPNLLLGGFPETGPGAEDRYEVYGNVFCHNPRESLLQASGRVSIHDNLFLDVAGAAIRLQNHDLPLRQAWVYHNTIYAAGTGISFGSAAPQGDFVVGNLIFAATPIAGTIAVQHDNLTDAPAAAGTYVTRPGTTLGEIDFYPLPGRCQGPPLDLTAVAADTDYDRDFNGTPKGGFVFRGAYAGEGTNPGWTPAEDIKPETAAADADADAGADADGDAAAGADADGSDDVPGDTGPGDVAGGDGADAGGTAGDDEGCGCRTPAGTPATRGGFVLGLVLTCRLLRRRIFG